MRFIAAIPNYNHGKTLVGLLDQLLLEDFDAIYVLDDASSDNSLKLLEPYKDKINLIKGPYNIGPAGNRNRIIPKLKPDDIIMFVDADMKLLTTNIRPTILKLFETNPEVSLFGGGIKSKDGEPMTYNYGLHQSQLRHAIGLGIEKTTVFLHSKTLARIIRPLASKFTCNVDILFFEPKERVISGSVSEGHFYIRGDVFGELNGFNETLRYHEGGELAYRLRHAGHIIKFTPAVWTKHLKIHSREKLRNKEAKKIDRIIKSESS